MQDKKPDLSFLHVFGSLCYPTNDHEDLGKIDAKADIGIFVGYVPVKKSVQNLQQKDPDNSETISRNVRLTADSMASETI
ncbi:hypothetical protein Tco_0151137 [Tanacetum coccineum]